MSKISKVTTKFYKYTSINSALKIIQDSTLKFTTPDEFNDPFDIFPYFPKEGFNKMMNRIRKENGFPNQRFTLKERDLMFKVPNTEKFRKETSKHSAVTCFSKYATILPMWAHYADTHKGCVLEFHMTHDDALKAALEMYSGNFSSDILTPLDVKYSETRPPAYDKNGSTKSQSLNAIFTKAQQWEYEQELRCVKNNTSGIYDFPRHQLKKVIFGLKTTEEDRNKIKESVNLTMKSYNVFIGIKEIAMERETFNLFIR